MVLVLRSVLVPALAIHRLHAIRLGRRLMQRLVRLLEEARRARRPPLVPPVHTHTGDTGDDEERRGDGEADDEPEVRADALGERLEVVGGVPGRVAADLVEVGVRLGGVVRDGQHLDVRVGLLRCRALDEVAEVDVGVSVAHWEGWY